MAIQFSKQYGSVLVIATDNRILFCRDVDGVVVVSQVDPAFFEEMVGYRGQYDNSNARPADAH